MPVPVAKSPICMPGAEGTKHMWNELALYHQNFNEGKSYSMLKDIA